MSARRSLPDPRHAIRVLGVTLALFAATPPGVNADETLVRVSGHAPNALLANARKGARLDSKQALSLTLSLPLRNRPALNTLLHRLYDKRDPLYHHYLTPVQFAEQFAPTQADYASVAAWATAQGLTIKPHANRLLLDVKGRTSVIESAFHVHLNNFTAANGSHFFAPDTAPALPAAIASHINTIVGLHNALKPGNNLRLLGKNKSKGKPGHNLSGPNGGFLASDIKKAYGLDGIAQDGTGQTVALLELDGFLADDITTYRKRSNLPNGTVEVRLVDDATGEAGSGAVEVVLDIDMVSMLAPNARLLVYEGTPTLQGLLDVSNAIAIDNSAAQVSSSWYLGFEKELVAANLLNVVVAEDQILQEMAAQGQSVFFASGDSGLYDFTGKVDPQYPATDPWITSVGGTKLTVDSEGIYDTETTWNTFAIDKNNNITGGASGGGISTLFPTPVWQLPFIVNNKRNRELSTQGRNYPDVSANAADNSAYDIYLGDYGGWNLVAGTSAAAPLWAGYIAQANQFRAENGLGPIGYLNPTLYDIATNFYGFDFNDIFDKSTNGNKDIFNIAGYTAYFGYDLTTGIGTMVGDLLFEDLVAEAPSYGPPAAPVVTALSGDHYVVLTWTPSLGASRYIVYRINLDDSTSKALGATAKLTFRDATVKNGTLYAYSVIPVGKGGEGTYGGALALPNVVRVSGGPAFSRPATILWATNVLSDSKVLYGTAANSLTQSVSNSTYTLAHKLALTGLVSGQKYYFQVVSFDGVATVKSKVQSFTAP